MAIRKTAKYYCKILEGDNIYQSLDAIPEIIKRFGFVDKYHSQITGLDTEFVWNHRIEGFFINRENNKLYADIYWQGDSTDGNTSVLASRLINKYIIPAKYDDVGGEWGIVCTHSSIEITKDELLAAIKAIIPLLSSELIRKRRKYIQNEPYVMPFYRLINKLVFENKPYNRYGDEEYKQKRHNAETAIRNLVEDAKKYVEMEEDDAYVLFNEIYDKNYKLDSQFTFDINGQKLFYY